MLDLANFLSQNSQYTQLGDNNSILAVINAKTINKTNNAEQSFRQLVLKFGDAFVGRILASLKAAGAVNPLLEASYLAVCTTGLDFSNSLVREQIDQIAAAGLWSVDDAAKIKSLGIYSISPVEQFFGEGQIADLAAVNTAMIELSRRNVLAQVTTKYNSMATLIRGGQITTMQEAIAYFSA